MTIAGASALAVAATLAVAAPANAARPAIRGSVDKSGYTVVAVGLDGRASSADADPRFRLAPTARVVTLHLRDSRGRYAGPVVVGRDGKRFVVGLRAGSRLGEIAVRRGFGEAHAKVKNRVASLYARSRKGRPAGARVLGRVRGKPDGRSGLGRDLDRDGLPGAFDVDDDGDLIFDSVDRKMARGSQGDAGTGGEAQVYNARWVMNGGLQISARTDQQGFTQGADGYALNQNAAGPFAKDEDFERLRDVMMTERGGLFFPLPDEPSELDCGGLSYCSTGGTGASFTRNQQFPSGFDEDGDGFGSMEPIAEFREGQDGLGLIQTVDPKSLFGLAPMAADGEIRGGDVFIERIGSGDDPTERPVTLRNVFGTLPALARWSDSEHDVQIEYPVSTGEPGTESNGFVLARDPDGNLMLDLTIWKPQRRAIPDSGEGAGWVDIGGLFYTVVGKTAAQQRQLFKCSPDAYTTEDEALEPTASGLLDGEPDAPVDVANTLQFTVNLSDCLTSSGISDTAHTTITVFVAASTAFGDAAEGVGFSFKF